MAEIQKKIESYLWKKQIFVVPTVSGMISPTFIAVSQATEPIYEHWGRNRQKEKCHYVFQYTLEGEGNFLKQGEGQDCWQVKKLPSETGFLCRVSDPSICYRYPVDQQRPWRFFFLSFLDPVGLTDQVIASYGHLFEVSLTHTTMQKLLSVGQQYREPVITLTPGDALFWVAGMLSMLCNSKMDNKEEGGHAEKLVKRALKLIEEHSEDPYNTELLAADLKISPEHLCRLFRKVLQKTPYECICRTKIYRACELLKTTSLGVREIAKMVGYQPGSHFTRVFRKYTGLTPSLYREKEDLSWPFIV